MDLSGQRVGILGALGFGAAQCGLALMRWEQWSPRAHCAVRVPGWEAGPAQGVAHAR